MKEQTKAGEPRRGRGPSCLCWHEESPLASCWLGQRRGDKPLWGTDELMPLHTPTCPSSFFPRFFSFLFNAWRKTAAPGNVRQGLLFGAGKQEGQAGIGWDRMGPEGSRGERLQVSFCLGRDKGEQRLPQVCPPEIGQDPTAGFEVAPELSHSRVPGECG